MSPTMSKISESAFRTLPNELQWSVITREVRELVPPGTVDHEIRLVSDRAQQRCTGSERHGKHERECVSAELTDDLDDDRQHQHDAGVVADHLRNERAPK